MIHGFRAYLATGGLLASALLLLTVLPYTTAAATTQPSALFFRPMDLPTTGCPANTAQQFNQDVDDTATPTTRLLDRTTAASSYTGTLMVPSVFAGRQAWLILRITDVNPDTVIGAPDELHEVFLTNGRGETIFLGVIDETTITPTQDLVFQIPQDFLTAGENSIEVQLDEVLNQDPNVIDATTLGDITIDSMRVCYGGYFVYNIPLVCGFTAVDLNATGAPTYRTPAIKKGDYATNILIRNPDQALSTRPFTIELYIEFATTTPIASTDPINNYPENNIISYSASVQLDPRQNDFLSCDGAADEVLAAIGVTDPNVQLFWKGAFIITQPIGDGVETSKLPLVVQAVYSYELTETKIRYQILRDPTGLIPRHLIGADLEMVVAISPFNQTRQGPGAFENLQIMRMIRNELVNGFGIPVAAADRVVLRVIEVSLGTGASQTITHIEPAEAPLESPLAGG